MVKIKICGITSLEDARAAIEAGADLLGFNFYRASPRFIEPSGARAIIGSLRSDASLSIRNLMMVGVFVDEASAESLVHVAEEAGVDAVQLHGDDSVDFCKAVKKLWDDRWLIKVLRVGDNFEPTEATRYDVDAVMLDAFHPELRGGTGRLVDWEIARLTAEAVPRLFLSGGLAPDNVADAIAAVRPYGVDACSSLESSRGKKNAERMNEFVRAARNE